MTRRGYLHKELAEALDALDQFPESETLLIPVRLDDCEPPRRELRELYWVDMFPSWERGLRRLLAPLVGDEGRAAERLNAVLGWRNTRRTGV